MKTPRRWYHFLLIGACLALKSSALTIKWEEDTPFFGFFIASHLGDVNGDRDVLAGLPKTYVSPSGYWKVEFFSYREFTTKLNHVDADSVGVSGSMQHIKRPPLHTLDPPTSDVFLFSLGVNPAVPQSDTGSQLVNHQHGGDRFSAGLAGVFILGNDIDMKGHIVTVSGRHADFLRDHLPFPDTFPTGWLALSALGLLMVFERNKVSALKMRQKALHRRDPSSLPRHEKHFEC